MKTAISTAAVLALAGAAFAQTETVSLPLIEGGPDAAPDSQPITSGSVDVSDNDNPIVGFTLDIVYSEDPVDFSWASDLALQLDFGGGNIVNIASDAFFGDIDIFAEADRNSIWDVDGIDSDDPGNYTHTFEFASPIDKTGTIGYVAQDGFNGGNSWDITITLNKIPTPGAAALLGVAGLAATRRRR
jgi:hypothetical protein